MGERISDAELIELESDNAERRGDAYMTAAEARALLAELRERRAQDAQHMATIDELVQRRNADLTSEEIEGLEFARWRLVEYAPESGSYVVRTKRALAALSKLLTRGNR